jgi:hypothetical protein
MFQGEFYTWVPAGKTPIDPTITPDIWPATPCDPTKTTCDTVTWNFNGQDHRISGMIRIPIHIYFTKDDFNFNKPPHQGVLTVGYGGNGGAG